MGHHLVAGVDARPRAGRLSPAARGEVAVIGCGATVPRLFDGHNDALTRPDADRFVSGRDGGHLDLPRARTGGLGGGICAVFTPGPGDEDAVPQGGAGGYALPLPGPVDQATAAAHAT